MYFFKYHGTGNDFILVDALQGPYPQLNEHQIATMCHRRFGIGADGLMIMAPSSEADFEMIYYNCDGKLATMCGNGGRCISQFYFDRGHGTDECRFKAADGMHEAKEKNGLIELQMHVHSTVQNQNETAFTINTGSPHYVKFCNDQKELDQILPFGKEIRFSNQFESEGINVNLVLPTGPETIVMRTYERGVEDETYSCGTGVVAAALVFATMNQLDKPIDVLTKGGDLSVRFQKSGHNFSNITLIGPAVKVFEGEYYL